ncbi:MAG: hypothetical protein KJ858_02430, partial [Nanoarchaeota archaeon]|nr:hypothetical protein [Nanoarchaeota archaeon]
SNEYYGFTFDKENCEITEGNNGNPITDLDIDKIGRDFVEDCGGEEENNTESELTIKRVTLDLDFQEYSYLNHLRNNDVIVNPITDENKVPYLTKTPYGNTEYLVITENAGFDSARGNGLVCHVEFEGNADTQILTQLEFNLFKGETLQLAVHNMPISLGQPDDCSDDGFHCIKKIPKETLKRGELVLCSVTMQGSNIERVAEEPLVVAKYIFPVIKAETPFFFGFKEQFEFLRKVSEIDSSISQSSKIIFIDRKEDLYDKMPDDGWRHMFTVANSIIPVFPEKKDRVIVMTKSPYIYSNGQANPAVPGVIMLKIRTGLLTESNSALAHELGHSYDLLCDEYSYNKWAASQEIYGSCPNPFPECCKFTFDCDECREIGLGCLPVDDLGDRFYCSNGDTLITSCGFLKSCQGMPYVDKRTPSPTDASNAKFYSVMSNYDTENQVYPNGATCPLKNC